MLSGMIRSITLGSFVLVALVLSTGCGSDSSEAERLSYKDAKGRSCTTERGAVPPTATCDQPPTPSVACAGGSTACYDVGLGRDVDETGKQLSGKSVLRNCAACCNFSTNSSTTTSKDCALVTCTTAADCLGYNTAQCNNGRCEIP